MLKLGPDLQYSSEYEPGLSGTFIINTITSPTQHVTAESIRPRQHEVTHNTPKASHGLLSDILAVQFSVLAETGEGVNQPLTHHGLTPDLRQLGQPIGEGLPLPTNEHDAHVCPLPCDYNLGVVFEEIDLK